MMETSASEGWEGPNTLRAFGLRSVVFCRKSSEQSGSLKHYFSIRCAGVAQLVEQLICNQQVGGSSPSAGSI